MLLHDAIKLCASFAAKRNPKDLRAIQTYHHLRLIPPTYDVPHNRVMATDGLVGACVTVGGSPLPNAIVLAHEAKIVATKVDQINTLEVDPNNAARLTLGVRFGPKDDEHTTSFELQTKAGDQSMYPVPPEYPPETAWRTIDRWQDVLATLGTVSQTKSGSVLRCTRFAGDYVASTDRARITLAKVPTQCVGLVPQEALKKIPKLTRMDVAFNPVYAFFRGGDVIAWTKLIRGDYPDLYPLVGQKPPQGWAIPTSVFVDAVRKASATSGRNEIEIKVTPTRLVVQSATARRQDQFAADFEIEAGDPHEKILDGKALLRVMSYVKTPTVFIASESDSLSPVRLEHASVVVLLYPKRKAS